VTYVQAIVIALVQGVTELFPVSSLGHSVLLPAWFGGSWQTLVTQSSQATSESSFYLAYIVALHVATALALLWFFRADWVRIVRGLFRSALRMVKARRWDVQDADERLAWMLVIATIPAASPASRSSTVSAPYLPSHWPPPSSCSSMVSSSWAVRYSGDE